MIYTDLTKKAMQIAYDDHYGQTDRGNTPYICHPLHVAEQMKTERQTVIALLHDVIEDTDETAESLIGKGIPADMAEAVSVLSRNEGETYEDYIVRVIASGDEDILRVKLQDLQHNQDESRIENNALPTHLKDRYRKAQKEIEGALEKMR